MFFYLTFVKFKFTYTPETPLIENIFPTKQEGDMKLKTFLSVMIMFSLFLGCIMAQSLDNIDIPYKKFVLKNGLTLIVHEDHKAPIVAFNVWYHVGSKNEKQGKTGFAHLFEHLMFNGSENYNDDYFKVMEKIGSTDMNGTTNNDRTNYFETVPTSALDLTLWMESDRMGHLAGAIDQGKLDEQRGVVQNEKRQGENEPYAISEELITQATYPEGHPYSWTVIGSMDDLNAASLDDVHEWFKNYYGAANAVICIAGDVNTEEVKQKVEKYFGDIPSGPPVARFQTYIAKRTGTIREVAQDRVPQPRIYMVWNIPQWGSEELAHLDLLSDILSSGKSSRLYKRLVYDEQIATRVSAYYSPGEIGSQFLITADVKPGVEVSKVEKEIDEELAKVMKDGPMPIAQIAKQVHLARTTVYTYLAAESFPERAPRSVSAGTGKLLAPYTAYLRKRCEEGYQNAQQLSREIHAQGFSGNPRTVLRWLQAQGLFPRRYELRRPWIPGTIQWRKSHKALWPERKGNRRPFLLPKSQVALSN